LAPQIRNAAARRRIFLENVACRVNADLETQPHGSVGSIATVGMIRIRNRYGAGVPDDFRKTELHPA
jgi:hypothetical protein